MNVQISLINAMSLKPKKKNYSNRILHQQSNINSL